MIPVRLKLQNFLAYRAPHPLILDGIHLACLTGANGAGKSSLLDAITWALWGESSKGGKRGSNNLIHSNATDMLVELDFLHEGQKYRVIRRRSKQGSGGKGQLDLFIFTENGELNEIRESNTNATQTRIDRLLRMDYDTFVNSAFLQQGNADRFTKQQPAKRKEILASILGLEVWESYQEQAKHLVEHYKTQTALLVQRLSEIREDLATEPAKQQELVDAQQHFEGVKAEYDTAYRLREEVADAPTLLNQAEARLSEMKNRHRRQDEALNKLRHDLEQRAEQIAAFEAVVAKEAEITAGYEQLKDAQNANQALAQKLSELRQLEKQRAAAQNAFDQERRALLTNQQNHQKQIERLQQQIASRTDTQLASVRQELTALETQADERETVQAQIAALNEEDATLRATNESLYTAMYELKDRINRLSDAEGATCPLCEQPLTEQHRADMLEALQATGKTQGDTYRTNEARIEAVKTERQQAEKHFKALTKTIKRIPALQKQIGELEAQANNAQQAQTELQALESEQQSIIVQLEQEQFAPEIRAQIATVEAQITAVGYSEAAYEASNATLQAYREYETLYQRLTQAQASLVPMRESQEREQGLEQQFSDELAQLEIEISNLTGEVEAQTQRCTLLEQRTQDERRLLTLKDTASNRVNNAQQALKALETLRERQKTFEAKRQQAAHQQGIYQELRDAFGKNGVSAMIIEAAIPELEADVNDLLSRMTDGRMVVTFSTQREKVTGGMRETLDIEIADELGTRSYEMYSGGESFRINFAIRVALSKMLARRAGAHMEALFIDEGFGTQDMDGRTKLVEAINAIKDDFALILVITHIDELKDAFPVHIAIEKTAEGSAITVL